jgi:V/A-type H+-transporting ATPase subunit I
MSDPITFLGISLALGVVQILFGLSIAFWDSLRKKDYMAAFGDNGGWISLLIGLLLLGGVKSGFLGGAAGLLGKILSILGAAVLVATQGREKTGLFRRLLSGVLSLYNITSYLGDILSYSRLLALGLATSAIAMIVNTLTNLVLSIPFVGWILSIVIFVGGHLFSVVVNTLGAFIHSLRLQYVEFFSKFYSGGGRIFQPLEYRTRYVKIVGSKPLGQQSK